MNKESDKMRERIRFRSFMCECHENVFKQKWLKSYIMQSALQVRRIFRIHSVCLCELWRPIQTIQWQKPRKQNSSPNSEYGMYCEPCYHQKSICITEKDVLYVCGILHTHKHINISNIKNISWNLRGRERERKKVEISFTLGLKS